jgi:hypothetical protein
VIALPAKCCKKTAATSKQTIEIESQRLTAIESKSPHLRRLHQLKPTSPTARSTVRSTARTGGTNLFETRITDNWNRSHMATVRTDDRPMSRVRTSNIQKERFTPR